MELWGALKSDQVCLTLGNPSHVKTNFVRKIVTLWERYIFSLIQSSEYIN